MPFAFKREYRGYDTAIAMPYIVRLGSPSSANMPVSGLP